MNITPRIPDLEGPHADFYARALGGVLHLQCCERCGRFQHPPRLRCPGCGSVAPAWKPSVGTGTLFSWTTTHRRVDRGWGELPYSSGVVELDEGVRLVAALDLPRDELRLDLPVVVRIRPMTDTFAFLSLERR